MALCSFVTIKSTESTMGVKLAPRRKNYCEKAQHYRG